LGLLDEDGALFVMGRLKELIIHSSSNIYPPEVETVLMEHPAVTLCAVIGWVRARMVSYKVPARVLVVDALPQAPTDKILKRQLLEQFSQLFEEKEEATDA
jgi:acyl-CoA synthetase (AMP-forming)/AMP-acid ligase II